MDQRRAIVVAILAIGLLGWSTTASAQNAVGIGGRTSVTANLALINNRPDNGGDSDDILIGTNLAYTTQSGRFEFGGGVTLLGNFTDSADTGIYIFVGEGRVNTNALGPDENILLYAGAVAGVAIIDSDLLTDELFVIGPKIGAELYVTPNIAVQLQDTLTLDSESGIQNSMTVGFKFVFQ